MIYTISQLMQICNSNRVLVGGAWVPARPDAGPFLWRAKAALQVLLGKADAVVWEEPRHDQ